MLTCVLAARPFLLLILLACWGGWMKRVCKFSVPPAPFWPYPENPGLALELAGSPLETSRILGENGTDLGSKNRQAAVLYQKLDFVFIALYVAFFAVAATQGRGFSPALPVLALVTMTAILDVVENLQILRMVRGVPGSSAKRFGQGKWLFYFLTIAAAGILSLSTPPGINSRAVGGMLLGVLLVATALGGALSAIKTSFTGIGSAFKLSLLGLIGLALFPLFAMAPFSWRVAAQYAIFIRVPLVLAAMLFGLPFLAFLTGAKTLLRGLFDLTPWSLFVVTLTALAAAGTACMTACMVLVNAPLRFGIAPIQPAWWPPPAGWLALMLVLSAPLIAFAIVFSARQKHSLPGLIAGVLAGGVLATVFAWWLIVSGEQIAVTVLPLLGNPRIVGWMANTGWFTGYLPVAGYPDPRPFHRAAIAVFLCVFALYVIVGVYGRFRLGKSRTVPALCSALMIAMMVVWMLSPLAFFFDLWRIPILLIVVLVGALTAQSARSDHTYQLRHRESTAPAPDPSVTLTAANTRRVVVVAANGGGIQAGAWAAQVLAGLLDDCGDPFRRSLRMISSVSGGSVGTGFFVHWLDQPDQARPPAEAAAESSLDEVAWGLAWPDFLRDLSPWIFGGLVGRGRAIEEAWRLNSARDPSALRVMDSPLSNWNAQVAAGRLPAVAMNATLAETGERLVLATTAPGKLETSGKAWVDASELHSINGEHLDVGVVTAARLSASFPYVTPAARSDAPGPQPHVVDGGYYDNYGMATLVEWLDAALAGAQGRIDAVLVLQVHGAPVDPNARDQRHEKNRGWFYQLIAPLATLAAVRTAGQIAHNDVELELLQKKWQSAGVRIDSIKFEFHNKDVPLSWHLTPCEKKAIADAWKDDMSICRQQVKEFLQSARAAYPAPPYTGGTR